MKKFQGAERGKKHPELCESRYLRYTYPSAYTRICDTYHESKNIKYIIQEKKLKETNEQRKTNETLGKRSVEFQRLGSI